MLVLIDSVVDFVESSVVLKLVMLVWSFIWLWEVLKGSTMGLRFMWVRYSFVRSWEGWGGKFEKVSPSTLGNKNKIICCDRLDRI